MERFLRRAAHGANPALARLSALAWFALAILHPLTHRDLVLTASPAPVAQLAGLSTADDCLLCVASALPAMAGTATALPWPVTPSAVPAPSTPRPTVAAATQPAVRGPPHVAH